MIRETLKKTPMWALLLAFFAAMAVSGSFTTLSSLQLVAEMMKTQMGMGMQITMIVMTAAVSTGLYALFNRLIFFVVCNFSRGGLLCSKPDFLKAITFFQTLSFAACIPTAILSFFFPLWLLVFSIWNVLTTLLCYVGLFLYLQNGDLAPEARKRVLLVMFIPLLVYLLLTGIVL